MRLQTDKVAKTEPYSKYTYLLTGSVDRLLAMPPAGLCFTEDFFKMSPYHSTTGKRIVTRIVALSPLMKRLLRVKRLVNFGQATCHGN